jgi:2-polyprenyl-3-methyl-5-hydroxy-6-metoxy-1,4-benzoquinol methylase
MKPIPADWYDEEYFTGPTKSNYQPYGPGDWADWLTDMVMAYLDPSNVLDVGCAYGLVVDRLQLRGIPAHGFDHSEFAISRASPRIRDTVWVGDAADPAAWSVGPVDLVLCTEVLEHLTPDQARAFLENAYQHAERALVLVTTPSHPEVAEGDESHINIAPMKWWMDLIRSVGWQIHRTALNEDPRSHRMKWAGRFLLLRQPQ